MEAVYLPQARSRCRANAPRLRAADPLQYCVSRQFQAFHDEAIESAVFTDPAAALEWLLQQPTGFSRSE